MERSQKQRDRDSRNAQMRKRILKAALKLFTRMSYEDVTIRKIAAVIGYSPAIIYYYFKNKDAIFAELRQEGFRKLCDVQRAARQSDDPRQRLYDHMQAYAGFALGHREYYEIMTLMSAPMAKPSKHAPRTPVGDSFELLIEDVQLAIVAGILPPAQSTRRIALLFLSMLHGLIALVLRQRVSVASAKTDQDMVSQTLAMFAAYVGIQPESVADGTAPAEPSEKNS
jgi:AcrR family transcriptional regulator